MAKHDACPCLFFLAIAPGLFFFASIPFDTTCQTTTLGWQKPAGQAKQGLVKVPEAQERQLAGRSVLGEKPVRFLNSLLK